MNLIKNLKKLLLGASLILGIAFMATPTQASVDYHDFADAGGWGVAGYPRRIVQVEVWHFYNDMPVYMAYDNYIATETVLGNTVYFDLLLEDAIEFDPAFSDGSGYVYYVEISSFWQ